MAVQVKSSAKIEDGVRKSTLNVVLLLFLLALLFPFSFSLGPVRLSLYRIILVLGIVPLIFMWLSGRAGKVVAADIFMLLFVVWSAVSLFAVHGVGEKFEFAVSWFCETFGSYLIARIYIRSAEQFFEFAKIVLIIMVVALPLALVETLTGFALVYETVGKLFGSSGAPRIGARFGFERANVFFEHPILFGVFSASLISILFYTFRSRLSFLTSLFPPGVSLFNAATSLSSGPIMASFIQLILVGWDFVVKSPHKWKLLFGIITTLYVALDFLSNRGPYKLAIAYLAFSQGSAFTRIHTWNFGTASLLESPIFGLGFNDFDRPGWLTASVDNFWLVIMMRHGIPGIVLLGAAIAFVLYPMMARKVESIQTRDIRTGLIISLVGIFLAISSVHLWNATYCWLIFLIGAGVWVFNEPLGDSVLEPAETPVAPTARHNRFRNIDPSKSTWAAEADSGAFARQAKTGGSRKGKETLGSERSRLDKPKRKDRFRRLR